MVKATNGDSDWRREWEDEQRLTRAEIEEERRLELEAAWMERELLRSLTHEREEDSQEELEAAWMEREFLLDLARENEFEEDLRLLGMLNEDDRVDDPWDGDDIPW